MNESDVREDIAMPLLRALGYVTGTANDIVREKTLQYDKNFLGLKKPIDPPLRGRADYILTVLGAGSWTLEIKGENVNIDRDAIEQAITYARHPEVSGNYAAILNGKRFVLFHNTQRSTDEPLIDLNVANPIDLAKRLEGMLSPTAIRQDCSPPKVDLGMPLASGYRSSAAISKGSILYDKFLWNSTISPPSEVTANLNESCRRMSGLRVSAASGFIKRDIQSRIKIQIDWVFPNDELREFAKQKQLLDMEYISLDSNISEDILHPTVFHVVGKIDVEIGDSLFDLVTWNTKIANIDMVMAYIGKGTGFIKNGIFRGATEARYEFKFPAIPDLQITQHGTGNFEFYIVRN